MSAFIVDTDHIDYLIAAAIDTSVLLGDYGVYWADERIAWHNADAVGAALLAENIASVSYRYADQSTGNLPGPIPNPIPAEYMYQPFLRVDPVQVLKAIGCYEYQSCEHPGWHDSEAHRFCDVLRRRYAATMPGYDDALWEVRRVDLVEQMLQYRRCG